MRALTSVAGQPALRNWVAEMDRAFAAAFAPRGEPAPASPALNIRETPEAYLIEAELPGIALDHVELLVEDRTATLRGERPAPAADAEAWRRRERWHGKFARTVEFAKPLDAERAAAVLKDGVLTLTLPKAGAALPKRVAVVAQ